MSNDGSIDEDFDGLIKVLWLNLRVTVDMLDKTGGKPKVSKKFDSKSPPVECVKVHVKSKGPVKQHSCFHSPQCKSEWNKIGCIKLYHLKSVNERISFLKEMKCCIKCGRKFQKFHKCRKDGKLEDAMCTNLQCKSPSALCNAHINDGNATPVLRRWLYKNGVKPDVIFGPMKPETEDKISNIPNVNDVNASVNTIYRNYEAYKNCRPNYAWYHANNLVSYRQTDVNPRKTSDVIDVDEGSIDVRVVNDDESTAIAREDNSDDEVAAVNARGKKVKALIHSNPLSAMDSPSTNVKIDVENYSVDSSQFDLKLTDRLKFKKVMTGKSMEGHVHSVKDGQNCQVVENVEGTDTFDINEIMPDDKRLINSSVTDDQNDDDGQSSKFPCNEQSASNPSIQDVIEVRMKYANSNKDVKSCENVPNMKYEVLDERMKLQTISKMVKSKIPVPVRSKNATSSLTIAQ